MGVGRPHRPHLDEAHAVAAAEELVRALHAREPAAEHRDAGSLHPSGILRRGPPGRRLLPMTFESGLYDRGYFEGLHKSHWFTNPKRKYEERNRDTLSVVKPVISDRVLELGSARGDVTFVLARHAGRSSASTRPTTRSRWPSAPVPLGGSRTSPSSRATSPISRCSRMLRSTPSLPSTSSSTSTMRRSSAMLAEVPARPRAGRPPRPLHTRPRALRRAPQGARPSPQAVPAAHRGSKGRGVQTFSFRRRLSNRSRRLLRLALSGSAVDRGRARAPSARRADVPVPDPPEGREAVTDAPESSPRTPTSTGPITTRGCTARTGSSGTGASTRSATRRFSGSSGRPRRRAFSRSARRAATRRSSSRRASRRSSASTRRRAAVAAARARLAALALAERPLRGRATPATSRPSRAAPSTSSSSRTSSSTSSTTCSSRASRAREASSGPAAPSRSTRRTRRTGPSGSRPPCPASSRRTTSPSGRRSASWRSSRRRASASRISSSPRARTPLLGALDRALPMVGLCRFRTCLRAVTSPA